MIFYMQYAKENTVEMAVDLDYTMCSIILDTKKQATSMVDF